MNERNQKRGNGLPGEAPSRARDVLSYFLQNPGATDSLEGVARWRVPEEMIQYKVQQVNRALEWLVEQGFLIQEARPGVNPLFRLNAERLNEAQQFIQDPYGRLYANGGDEPEVEHRLLELAKEWLDCVLLYFHAENPVDESEQRGFARTYASIQDMLARKRSDSGGRAQQEYEDCEKAVKALLDAMTPDCHEPLCILYRHLGLKPLELFVVLLCLAPELDTKYQTAFGYFHDEMLRRTPTFALILGILDEDPVKMRTELAASGGLTRWRLLESGGNLLPHGDDPVRLDSAIVAWLLGTPNAPLFDPRVEASIRLNSWPGGDWLRQKQDVATADSLARRFRHAGGRGNWLALCGEDVDGWRALVEVASYTAPRGLVRIVPPLVLMDLAEREEVAIRIVRAVLLLDAIAVLDLGVAHAAQDNDLIRLAPLTEALAKVVRPKVVIVPELERALGLLPQNSVEVEHRAAPSNDALAAVYMAAMTDKGLYLSSSDAAQIALSFPLVLSEVEAAVRLAVLQGAAGQAPHHHAAALTAACRRIASPELPRFARRIHPTFGLDDVVLPKDRLDQLRQIVAHVRLASKVLNNWGFARQLPYGRGIAALFCGPSGTGKTMAAQAIAYELQTDTYVVDLSRVMSKYIGETEKFLDATFRDAQRVGAVLQVDEAEALFGKRSEVKDAHDRYANLEVAYLLQRMEAFEGVAILTTNLRQNLDQAFLRRLRFVVDFPKPDVASREKIWLHCLPKDAPFHNINVKYLARKLDLTGGHIRQITVRAAFAAASEGSSTIEMRHLIDAARAELLKLGMSTAERELAGYELNGNTSTGRVA